MSRYNISVRYSKALFKSASEKKVLDRVSRDMQMLFNTLTANKNIRLVLKNPVIRSADKLQILSKIFSGRLGSDVMDFLKFLIDKNREDLLEEIAREYILMQDREAGFINLTVTSRNDISAAQKEVLKKKMESYTGKKVKIAFKLDPKLIGGFVVKIGDTVIDASVKRQLELLRHTLLNEANLIS